jgi:hypothetical protein
LVILVFRCGREIAESPASPSRSSARFTRGSQRAADGRATIDLEYKTEFAPASPADASGSPDQFE